MTLTVEELTNARVYVTRGVYGQRERENARLEWLVVLEGEGFYLAIPTRMLEPLVCRLQAARALVQIQPEIPSGSDAC